MVLFLKKWWKNILVVFDGKKVCLDLKSLVLIILVLFNIIRVFLGKKFKICLKVVCVIFCECFLYMSNLVFFLGKMG